MKLLLDQDVYAKTAQFLTAQGHDLIKVADLGLDKATDTAILEVAQQQGRILITRDRDYGNLVFVKKLGAGVIYLRILPNNSEAVHHQLQLILTSYSSQQLAKAFVVINHEGYRLRNLNQT